MKVELTCGGDGIGKKRRWDVVAELRRVRRPTSVTPRASRIVVVAEVPRSEECFPQGYMLGHSEGFQFQGHGTLDRRLQFVDS